MKYIKQFEAFEDSNEVKDMIDIIRDICIELKDDGYMVFVSSQNDADKKKIVINVCRRSGGAHSTMYDAFEYIEVKEVFARIIDYMSSQSSVYEIELMPGGDISTKRVYNNNTSKKFPEDNVESRQFNLIITL